MKVFSLLLLLSFFLGLLRIMYKKKFFLSILISLEIILLNIIIFNFSNLFIIGDSSFISLSIFILALAAVEARIGISIITLISRKFTEKNISTLTTLKK